jgi:hypothetical protein
MSAGGSELTSIFCWTWAGFAAGEVCGGGVICAVSGLAGAAVVFTSLVLSKFAQPESAQLMNTKTKP